MRRRGITTALFRYARFFFAAVTRERNTTQFQQHACATSGRRHVPFTCTLQTTSKCATQPCGIEAFYRSAYEWMHSDTRGAGTIVASHCAPSDECASTRGGVVTTHVRYRRTVCARPRRHTVGVPMTPRTVTRGAMGCGRSNPPWRQPRARRAPGLCVAIPTESSAGRSFGWFSP